MILRLVIPMSTPLHTCHTTATDIIEITVEFIITVPTLILYYFLFRLYFNKKKSRVLNDSFFTLFMLNAVFNILAAVINFVFQRIPSIGLFCDLIMYSFMSQFNAPVGIVYFLLYYIPYAQVFSITIVSFNRMCSVIMLKSFHRVWKVLTPIAIVVTIIGPLGFCWHLLISPAKYLPNLNGLAMDYKRVVVYPRNSMLSMCLYITCGSLVSIFTIATCARMASMIMRHRKSEISLLVVGAVQSFGVLLVAAHALIMYNQFVPILMQKRFILVDFVCFNPPWTLILLSQQIRERVSRLINSADG